MTKLTSLSLAILLAFNLTACNDNDDKDESSALPETPTTPAPEPETPEEEVPVPKVYLDENLDQLTALPA
ncbi:hypothetical protein, partial [Acinetobacter sp. YH16055]|uniref:hypothetical protein n=1 Tax=Acinetobacter sp. YH16055 TaxID=2601193 RepID=UPI001C5512E5